MIKILHKSHNDKRHTIWKCECECGNILYVRQTELKRRKGCRSCASIRTNTTHGLSRKNGKITKLYKAWDSMKNRCYNPKYRCYNRYGGRGIKVCNEWLNSFETFAKYIGNPPSPKHSIDRINNDGNYEPGNIRWATNSEQQRNKSWNT